MYYSSCIVCNYAIDIHVGLYACPYALIVAYSESSPDSPWKSIIKGTAEDMII